MFFQLGDLYKKSTPDSEASVEKRGMAKEFYEKIEINNSELKKYTSKHDLWSVHVERIKNLSGLVEAWQEDGFSTRYNELLEWYWESQYYLLQNGQGHCSKEQLLEVAKNANYVLQKRFDEAIKTVESGDE